jgi:tRNA (guanine37-N1)-methyltransferase
MMAPPVVEAVEEHVPERSGDVEIILLSASGERFDQAMASNLAQKKRIGLICGRYEGVDERVL